MSLNDKIRKSVIEEISGLRLQWPFNLDDYVSENHKLISFLYNNNIIDDSNIEMALEVAVINQAKRDYELLKRSTTSVRYPDQLPSAIFLAYAIENLVFSQREVSKLRFDHGMTAESFSKMYATKCLLSGLRQQLLTEPKSKPKMFNDSEYFDSHPADCH